MTLTGNSNMKKIINAIALATDITPQNAWPNLSRLFLSDMRMYLWDGFAVHNVKDRYIYYFGDPEIDDDGGWFVVRDCLMPIVKELDSRFGEFGAIDWENV